MTNAMASPYLPHPKHLNTFAWLTVNDGVFSLWKGHSPTWFPDFCLSSTYPDIISTISAACFISSMLEIIKYRLGI